MGVSWNEDDKPVPPASLWRGLFFGLIGSAFCWGFILGLAWACYRLSFVI